MLSRVAAITDGRGLTTRYTYDQIGRVTRFSYATGTPVSLDFHQAGNLLSQTDATGTKTITHDVANRIIGPHWVCWRLGLLVSNQ